MGRWVRGLAQFGREVVAREARMRSGLDNVGARVRGAWVWGARVMRSACVSLVTLVSHGVRPCATFGHCGRSSTLVAGSELGVGVPRTRPTLFLTLSEQST